MSSAAVVIGALRVKHRLKLKKKKEIHSNKNQFLLLRVDSGKQTESQKL